MLLQIPSVYARLGGDGFDYYVLARSPFFDHDLELANDFEGLHASGLASPTGGVASPTPVGTALLWTPALLLAHLGTLLARGLGLALEADGFSAPYQAVVVLASFVYGALALFLTEQVVRRYHGPAVAFLVAFALWVGTPLGFYAVVQPFMSHACSAFAATVFLVLWLETRERRDVRSGMALGFVGGLMALVRIQDGVLLLLPLADFIWDRRPGWLKRTLAFFVGPVLAALLQAYVWARLWGPGFLGSVQGVNRFTGESHLVDFLLSPRHGAFIWTPLWLVGALGLVLALRRAPRLAALCLLGVGLAVFMNASLADWWGADSFGQRRLLGVTLLFGLGLGEVVTTVAHRPLLPIAAILAAFAFWNQQLGVIYNSESVAPRGDAVTFDRLATAQAELLSRQWMEAEGRLPRGLFNLGYDNLKGFWLDPQGSRPSRLRLGQSYPGLPFMIGPGWFAPEREGEIEFRRSRGSTATLRLPIRAPTELKVWLRVRSLIEGRPVRVSLSVNGQPSGQADASSGWSDLGFAISETSLEPGFNTFRLTYYPTPRDLDADHEGANAAVAVAEVRVESAKP